MQHRAETRRQGPWIALVVIVMATWPSGFITFAIGIAIPDLSSDLNKSGATEFIDWVVTIFLLGQVLVLPVAGWLSDRISARTSYLSALVTFALGSGLCAIATDLPILLVGRFAQGVAAGVLLSLSFAFIFAIFPIRQRGSAMGVWSLTGMLAPVLGPPLSGAIVDQAGWRWLFLACGVVSSLALVLALWLLPDVGHRSDTRFDWTGWAQVSTVILVVVVSARQASAWNLGPGAVAALAALALSTSALFIRHSLRHPAPVIDVRVFRIPTFAATNVVGSLTQLALTVAVTFLPLEMLVVRKLSPQDAGLVMVPLACGMAVAMLFGGWLVDRIGGRVPLGCGLVAMLGTLWPLAHLHRESDHHLLVILLVGLGAGIGLVFIPSQIAAMSALPDHLAAHSSALLTLTRQLSATLGLAVISAAIVATLGTIAPVAADRDAAQSAYNAVFLSLFWVTVVAAVVSLLQYRPRRHAIAQLDVSTPDDAEPGTRSTETSTR